MDEDWQNKCKNQVERCKHILENKILCDCTFLVEKQQVSGHRMILAMASPVFYAMFFGNLPENSGPISISDISAEVFSQMLRYIYHDEVNISSCNNACDLYSAAQKYMLENLKCECIDFLKRNLNINIIVSIFEFAKFNNEESLEAKCLKEIQINTSDVLKTSSFLHASEDTLEVILGMQKLNIESEVELVRAVNKWAEAESERKGDSPREVVKKIVKKLRLLTLNQSEYIEAIADSNIFNSEEKLEVILKIIEPDLPPMKNGLCPSMIKRKPWKPMCVSELEAMFQDIVNSRCDGSDWLTSTFTSNTAIALIGIKIRLQRGPVRESYNEHIAVKLGLANSDKLIAEGKICGTVNYNTTMEILFDSPASIKPYTEHAINILLFKQGSYPIGKPTSSRCGEGSVEIDFISHSWWERAHPWNTTVISAVMYAEPLD